jgi:amino acid adenylation domain-containing protein/non-ribosomal peptide synthase protein (TIGR01720 family)
VAVSFDGEGLPEHLSFGELCRRSSLLASRLRGLGVGAEVVVGIWAERRLELLVGLVAILEAGGAYLPLDPSLPSRRVAELLSDAGAPVVLVPESGGPELPSAGLVKVSLAAASRPSAARGEPSAGPSSAASAPSGLSPAYLIYTSGSTGRPKGVLVSHRAIVNRLVWMQEAFGLGPEGRVLQKTSLGFDVSVWELFWPLLYGGQLVLARPGGHRESGYLARAIERLGITTVHFVPSVLRVFVEEEGRYPSLRQVIASGEALPADLRDRWSSRHAAPLFNLFGPTEAAVEVTWERCVAGAPRVTIGRPISNLRIDLLDRRLRPAPIGVSGELYIGGVGLARGYHGRPGLTAERFLPDPFAGRWGRPPGSRMYRSGDRARYLADGRIDFQGRLDFQLKLRGVRIEPGEIEAVLGSHPGIRDSVVVARAAGAGGEPRLVAYLVPSDPAPEVAELSDHLRSRLPSALVPTAYVMLESLPLTTSGKVDRRALPEPGDGGLAREAYQPPRTAVEEALAGLWSELLGVSRVGVRDDFFALGGHSLLATRLCSRLHRLLGVELPLRWVFERPRLEELASVVEASRRGGRSSQLPPLGPAPATAEPVLSFAQERLWFLHQLESEDPSYNIPAAFRLEGRLDPEALRGALDRLAARQAVLRTSFGSRDGKAVTQVAAAVSVALPWIDLERLPASLREAEAQRLVAAESVRPFDLAAAPLLRATLVRLGRREHLLIFVLHHIVGDGWSVGVIRRELAALYRRLAVGGDVELPPLPVRYADFAHWQREWLRGEVLDRQLEHWRRRLEGVPVLELPTDRPRPAVQSWNGAVESRLLPAELQRRAVELGRTSGTTLFMTLLAVLAVLLERTTGQEDVAVGTPVANRPHGELEGLIGFFVNTLVLRLDLGGEPPFAELLARVRETALDAYDHQDLPFEKLVDELRPERSLSRTPLFQVMFTVAEGLRQPPELVGLEATPVELGEEPAKFDLAPSVEPRDDGLLFHLGYATDLFDRTTVRRLLGHYETLLRGALQAPERRISELPLLTAPERHQLRWEWSVGAASAAVEAPVHRLFEERSASAPGSVALVCGGEEVSYGELDRRAGVLARRLHRLGLAAGSPVALCVERSPEIVVGTLGIWKAGCASVPLDPSYPAARLAFQLEDSAPPVVVTTSALAGSLPDHGAEVLEIDRPEAGGEEGAGDGASGDGQTPAALDRLAYLIYTSGTTGRPKAVAVAHRQLAHTLVNARRRFGYDAGDTSLSMASFAFDISFFEWLTPLLAGGTVRILRREELLDPERLLDHLVDATVVHAVPSLMRVMVDAVDRGGVASARPRRIFVGGDAVPAELLRELRRCFPASRVEVLYGPTEATIICASHPVSGEPGVRPMIGRPLDGVTLRLLDRRRRPVPAGVAGEIHVGGGGVTGGYLGREELTAERYPEIGGERWYRTGDLARWRSDGHLEFLGRGDHQVKIRGHRIELGEVEAVLAEHPALHQVVAAAVADGGEPRLVAYLVAGDGAEAPTTSELHRFAGDRLPDHMIPAAFVVLDELPLTPAGKVDRRALPTLEDERPELGGEYAEPNTETERVLAEIWARVLRIDRVGVHDNFFELGGDSILSIQILSHAARAGLHLTPKQMFEHQTVAELAAVAGDAPASIAEQGLVVGPVPLLPVQRFFFEQYRHDLHHFTMPLLLTVRRPLDGGRLARALHHLLLHHDALRLRFEHRDGGWHQRGLGAEGSLAPVLAVDLSALPEDRHGAAVTAAGSRVLASLDLSAGPVVRAVTFDRGRDADTGEPRSGRLLLAPHHLVVDGVSWRILLEDLQAVHEQLDRGEEVRLPAKTTSFRRWAERLAERARSPELRGQLEWWRSRSGMPAARLAPAGGAADPGGDGGGGRIVVGLDEDETRSLLHEVPPVYNTRIQEVLLAALAVACRELTGTPAVWVDLEGHGREELFEDVDLTRTVGWLTSIHPVLLDLGAAAGPGGALKTVKEQLRSVPENGLGFGLLRYLSDDPEVTSALASLPRPEISFNYLGQLDLGMAEDSPFDAAPESPGEARSRRQTEPHPVAVDAQLAGSRLRLGWRYDGGRIGRATVEELAGGFVEALRGLIEHCRSPEAGGYTASDFGLAELDEEGIEAALDEIELEF